MNTPFINGKTTVLRPVSMTDVPLFTRWMNDPETRTYLIRRFPLTEQDEKSWVEKVSGANPNPSNIVMVIEAIKGRRPIGTMGLHNIDWIDRTAVTGTVIGEKNSRGKGFATDAKMTLLKYAFETLGLYKIISHVDARNKASVAYSLHCGYKVEAVLKEELFRDGKRVDKIVMACFYESWQKAYKKY